MRQVKKEAEGIIIALDGKIAKVRAGRHSDCDTPTGSMAKKNDAGR